MTTYICNAFITIEVSSNQPMTDQQVEDEVRRRFFAEIETYKQDEVHVEIIEEQEEEQ